MIQNIVTEIEKSRIIAIVRGVSQDKICSLADALYHGGIRCLEVTFVQQNDSTVLNTVNSLRILSENFSDKLIIGAGTVMTTGQVETAKDCGCSFIVSPNTDEAVIKKTKELDLVSIPGAATPTEVANAYAFGGDIIKIFPAGLLGADYIKALKGPYSHIPMAAVGNVTLDNMAQLYSAGACAFGISSSLAPVQLIEDGKFSEITDIARTYTDFIFSL